MSALQNHQLGSFGSTFCCQKVEKDNPRDCDGLKASQ